MHLEALRRVEFVEVAAIAGRRTRGRATPGQRLLRHPVSATDYREILRDPAIDAVHICTPNTQHFAMAKSALQAGKHVLCEKPLATRVAEGEELVALAAKPEEAQLRLSQFAFLSDGAANARPAESWRTR